MGPIAYSRPISRCSNQSELSYCRKHRLALAVYNTKLRFLGLVSLRQVNGGRVAIYRNPELCHVDSFNWTAAGIVNGMAYFRGNADEAKCRKLNILARSANLPEGLSILLALISFFFLN